MEKTLCIIGGFGTVRLKLDKTDIIVTSVPKKIESKFKEKYPDRVIGKIYDYIDDKKLSQALQKVVKSLD